MVPNDMPACDTCGSHYTSPLAAALCCDKWDNDDERGYN